MMAMKNYFEKLNYEVVRQLKKTLKVGKKKERKKEYRKGKKLVKILMLKLYLSKQQASETSLIFRPIQ